MDGHPRRPRRQRQRRTAPTEEAGPASHPAPSPPRRWRRRWPVLAVAVLGGVVSLAVLSVQWPTRAEVGPGTVQLRAQMTLRSGTALELPPLGQVSARTHRAPLRLVATVHQVDTQQLQRTLAEPDPETTLREEVERDVGPLVERFARRTAALSVAVGVLTGLLVPGRRWSLALAGGVGGLAATALVLGVTWRTYDAEAFERPRFDGPIEQAPDILRTIRRHVDSFDEVRGRADVLSRQLSNLYSAASAAPDPGPGDTAILHVSDIHLNPLGLEFVARLARQFGVEGIVDTGDLTSFGLPIEARIGSALAAMPVPYYLVPGNHDSEDVRKALAAVGNVTVLDGRVADIAGVRVLGVADPTFTADNRTSAAEAADVKRREAPAVAELARRERVDVLAVHDPILGADAAGAVPLVIQGHRHKRASAVRSSTRFLSVGTTGASGLGAFTVSTDLHYEAEILYFDGGRLIAVDYVSLAGVNGSFRIDREVVPNGSR